MRTVWRAICLGAFRGAYIGGVAVIMKFIHNLVVIDLKNDDGDMLLANGINGFVDLIHGKERIVIEKWLKAEEIIPAEEEERELFHSLEKRQYFLTAEEEDTIKKQIIEQLKKRSLKKEPDSAWFVLTYRCNFHCPYCYESTVKREKTMTVEMIDKVFEVHPKLQHIGFFGGEPFLPENRELIEYIVRKAPKAEYYAITNGFYLEEYMDLLQSVQFTNIQVTLDGTEKNHNETRFEKKGQPTYVKILSGIQTCLSADIPITIRMNLSSENYEDLVREKAIIQSTEWGKKAAFEIQPLFQCGKDEQNLLYEKLLKQDQKGKPGANQILTKMPPLSNFLYSGKRLRPILRACDPEGVNRFYDPFGNIYNCILAVGQATKAVGTYYPEFRLKEKSFLTRDITQIKKCRTCKNALFCGGGCPNGITGEDIYSPNCYNFYNEIENMIPAIFRLRQERMKEKAD